MRHVVLVSCVSKKRDRPAEAWDLYQSTLFKKSLAYARILNPDHILILSARHGAIDLDEEVAPYDETLNRMRAAKIRAWSERVLEQLQGRFDPDGDRFTFLAGLQYRRYLLPNIRHADIPMEGLPIGKQLQFLTRALACS